jgi:hypothetical protein
MNKSLSDLRKAENEAVFRARNEKIQKERNRNNRLAIQEGQPEFLDYSNLLLQYVCECSDENCKSRVGLLSKTYNLIHENRKLFIIAKGHEAQEIETVISKRSKYNIVEKNFKPNEDDPKLHTTDVDNS